MRQPSSRSAIVAHVTTVPWSLFFFRGQVGYLHGKGLTIHAISSPGVELARFGEQEPVHTHAISMSRTISPRQDIVSLIRLVRVLRNFRPSIVHGHTPKGGLLSMAGAYVARTPVRVYSVLGFPYMTSTGLKRLLLKWTERISCALAQDVICVSHSLRAVAVADGICSPKKIKVLHGGSVNGVDAEADFNPANRGASHRHKVRDELGIDSDALVIAFVGRIVRDKGANELASAWAALRNRYTKARLVLAGPLESEDPIDPDILRTLQTDDRVHVLGMVDHMNVLYSAFDLVVLPTYREGFPNVPLEAAAMEIPVVATDIPGCVDAIQDGVTGTLVPPRDARALENAIAVYLEDPYLRRQHGMAGRARVLREFRQEVIWEAIYQEYMRLLRERGIESPSPRERAGAV